MTDMTESSVPSQTMTAGELLMLAKKTVIIRCLIINKKRGSPEHSIALETLSLHAATSEGNLLVRTEFLVDKDFRGFKTRSMSLSHTCDKDPSRFMDCPPFSSELLEAADEVLRRRELQWHRPGTFIGTIQIWEKGKQHRPPREKKLNPEDPFLLYVFGLWTASLRESLASWEDFRNRYRRTNDEADFLGTQKTLERTSYVLGNIVSEASRKKR